MSNQSIKFFLEIIPKKHILGLSFKSIVTNSINLPATLIYNKTMVKFAIYWYYAAQFHIITVLV